MNPNQPRQTNPEIEAAASAFIMLRDEARKNGALPDTNGVISFDNNGFTITLRGEMDKGPHGNEDPWVANVTGESGPGSTKSVRITPEGLRGTDCGFEDDGTSNPLDTSQSLAIVAQACSYDTADQVAA